MFLGLVSAFTSRQWRHIPLLFPLIKAMWRKSCEFLKPPLQRSRLQADREGASSRSGQQHCSLFWPSERRICDRPEHLQRGHLHIWDLGVLRASRRAVTCRPPHRTEACGAAPRVGEARRQRHGGTAQEAA